MNASCTALILPSWWAWAPITLVALMVLREYFSSKRDAAMASLWRSYLAAPDRVLPPFPDDPEPDAPIVVPPGLAS